MWSLERDDGLDSFHWVTEADLLDTGELNEISTAVWGDNDREDVDGDAEAEDAWPRHAPNRGRQKSTGSPGEPVRKDTGATDKRRT